MKTTYPDTPPDARAADCAHAHMPGGEPCTLTRRTFVARAACALAAAALASPAGAHTLRTAAAAPARALSCIVIGAGLAGLAAAYRLTRAGWRVTVIEARERLGGRVLSYRFRENASLVCELGAEWIGESHERMRALAAELGLELQVHRFDTALIENGRLVPAGAWRFSPESERAWRQFAADFARYTQRDRERLDRYDWWTWLETIGFTQADLRLRDLMDSTDFGESIRHVSAYVAASEYLESSPANEMDYRITGGNSQLIERLAQRLEPNTIRTNMEVEAIAQRRGSVRVAARATRGDPAAPREELVADACICTLPARALKRVRFDPPLPSAQAEALTALQYARITKASVLFSERFWKADDQAVLTDATAHFCFHSTQRQPGTEGIFCSYAVGEKADILAAQDTQRRTDMLTRDLAPLSPRIAALARAAAFYAWQRDRYTGGAYALYRPGQWFTVRPALAKAHGNVLFAGEHLAEWQGFMEGAVVTGEAAAQALVRDAKRRPAVAGYDALTVSA